MSTRRPCLICGTPTNGSRCPQHGGNRRTMSTTARGYGAAHQRTRKLLLPRAIGTPCPRCGQPMRADQPLDLDHSVALIDNPTSRGDRIVHARCNRGGVSSAGP